MEKSLVGLVIIIVFALLVLVSVVNTTQAFSQATGAGEQEPSSFLSIYLLPILAFTGVGVGIIMYYVMGGHLEGYKAEKKGAFRAALLATLGPSQRVVIELLLENKGAMPQHDLTKQSGMSKVQATRLLVSMEKKRLITKKSTGKTNKIEINRDLLVLLY